MDDLIRGLFGISAIFAGAWLAGVVLDVAGRLFDWIDRRRGPAPLTREQLAARGAPPWPYHDRSWDELWPADAEGEVIR